MGISAMQARALRVSELYDELNTQRGQPIWAAPDLALGFVCDVGDLARIVQATSGLRAMSEKSVGIEHELADCLWSVLVLADRFDVDLEDAFATTMAELEHRVSTRLVELREP